MLRDGFKIEGARVAQQTRRMGAFQCSGSRSLALPDPSILITGGSGRVGSATARALSSHFSCRRIRVGSRAASLKATRERLQDVAGVEIVELDTEKHETVTAAFRGIQLVLIVPPSGERRVKVAVSYVDAAVHARVAFMAVTSTILGTDESLILGRQWKQIQLSVLSSGLPYCFIQLPVLLEDFTRWSAQSIKLLQLFSYPIAPQMQFPYISLSDVGLATAYILIRYHSHIGQTYSITSLDMVSCAELATFFSEALGKEIIFREVSSQEHLEALVRQGMARWDATAFSEFWRQAAQARCVSSDHFFQITGRAALTVSKWLNQRSVVESFRS